MLTSLAIVQYTLIENQPCVYSWFLTMYAIFVMRNYSLMAMIENGVKNKTSIKNHLTVKESYKNEFHINVLSSTLVEALTYVVVRVYVLKACTSITVGDVVWFIPFSFVFEAIFDFFHYWTHRMVHHHLLYAYIHKKHHKHLHPITITTYYQEPIDLIITNSIPTLLTLLMVPIISLPQYHIMLIYKEYIEISGHCGRHLFPTNSFTQCIWLPRLFSIQLYAEEHDLHHSVNKCNYSKRFTVWDKVFGTYLRKRVS
jgi:sterol desaturase/sphingolipid hydroxylase (fatty acid hydroxylase superfamily)